MLGRLLENFQKGVECARGEHMYLVYDINSVLSLNGGEIRLVAQVAYIVNAVIRGGVYLDNVEHGAVVDSTANFAFVAGVAVVRGEAVDGL